MKDSDRNGKTTFFPRAILSVKREEYYQEADDPNPGSHQPPLQLTIKRKFTEETTTLPEDLQGAVFTIAPVGSVASKPADPARDPHVVLPTEDGWTALLNGDGMIYRLSFQDGQAILSSRFVKTPSHYADQLTHEKYTDLPFINLGLARLSLNLGSSNQVNTAFLPMRFPGEPVERLLATWDVGRAYEIDPDSLRVIAPVGPIADWSDLIKMNVILPFTAPVERFVWPFKQLMLSAHPAFDPNNGEMFTVNVVKSLNTFLWLTRWFPFQAQEWLINFLPDALKGIAKAIAIVIGRLLNWLLALVSMVLEWIGLGSDDTLYLVRWTGEETIQKWPVVLPGGRRAKIRQTVHQMGITQDYIVLADTAFKIVIEDLLPSLSLPVYSLEKIREILGYDGATMLGGLRDRLQSGHEFLRRLLSYPQSPNTLLYIIDRQQISNIPPGEPITARRVRIQGEFTHYLVDYDNPDGKITLNAALNKATDPAEFIHSNDTSPFAQDPKNPDDPMNQALKGMAGMFNNGLAVNRPGFYVIDGAKGKVERTEILDLPQAEQHTWSLGLYAYRDDQPTAQFDDIYWSGFGAWENLLSEYFYQMYDQYKYQDLPLTTILKQIAQGVPVTLNRLHIDRQAPAGKVLSIADSYEFPAGYFSSSPQFVPRAQGQGGTNGYVVCNVIHSDRFFATPNEMGHGERDWSDNSEIWIFDAANLQDGPQYRLSHPQLNLGFTLHTTWLQQAAPAPSRPYDVRKDFGELVKECMDWHPPAMAVQIQALFEEVYQQFDQDRKSV